MAKKKANPRGSSDRVSRARSRSKAAFGALGAATKKKKAPAKKAAPQRKAGVPKSMKNDPRPISRPSGGARKASSLKNPPTRSNKPTPKRLPKDPFSEMEGMISAGRKKHGPGYRGETQTMRKGPGGKKSVTGTVRLAPKKRPKAKKK
jgi:hypothetical protein